jgi:hypothetical protein
MEIEVIEKFFLWCLIINTGIYAVTAITVLLLRDLYCKIQEKLFGLDEKEVMRITQQYLATYKLLITVFNFTPWIAMLIIK